MFFSCHGLPSYTPSTCTLAFLLLEVKETRPRNISLSSGLLEAFIDGKVETAQKRSQKGKKKSSGEKGRAKSVLLLVPLLLYVPIPITRPRCAPTCSHSYSQRCGSSLQMSASQLKAQHLQWKLPSTEYPTIFQIFTFLSLIRPSQLQCLTLWITVNFLFILDKILYLASWTSSYHLL